VLELSPNHSRLGDPKLEPTFQVARFLQLGAYELRCRATAAISTFPDRTLLRPIHAVTRSSTRRFYRAGALSRLTFQRGNPERSDPNGSGLIARPSGWSAANIGPASRSAIGREQRDAVDFVRGFRAQEPKVPCSVKSLTSLCDVRAVSTAPERNDR